MPCNNNKNNCCRNPFPYLVLLGSFPWSGTSRDFLDTLDPRIRIRLRFNFLKVNTEDDNWIDLVKTRLKCLCKKYGRKASIISTIFVSDKELKLSVLKPYFRRIYLTGSTDTILVNTFGYEHAIPLPIYDGGGIPISRPIYDGIPISRGAIDGVALRSNNYYRNSSESIAILNSTDTSSTYSIQTQSKMLERASVVNIVDSETLESYPDFSLNAIDIDPTMFDDLDFPKKTNKKLLLTESAASYFIVGAHGRGFTPSLDLSTGRVSVDINELQYEAQLNYRGFPGLTDAEKIRSFMAQGAINYDPDSYTLRVNNAAATVYAINILPFDKDF
jgi:hypothetical protein